MLFSAISYCQPPNFTIYDCTTLVPIEAVWDEPTTPGVCYTTAIVTQQWCCLKYSSACNCFFNDATAQQQADYIALINANYQDGVLINTNNFIDETHADDIEDFLNFLYPDAPTSYIVICPNMDSGMMYAKISATHWAATSLFPIPSN